jgi:hypothetical protein
MCAELEYRFLRVLQTMRGVCGVALLVSSASFSHVQKASAQEAATTIPVAQDEEVTFHKKNTTLNPYAPKGIPIGGLRLYPSLDIGTVLTSNVRREATNQQTDIALELRPTVSFASDWSRHSWTGSATADWLRYNSVSDLSTLTGAVQSAFRLDILHTTHADFAANYALNQTGVENTQVPNTAKNPRRDHLFNANAAITHDFGGLETTATTGISRSIYENVALVGGGTEINADRNYWEPTLALRATLGDNGAPLKPFAQVVFAPRFHDQTFDRNNLKRDSQGLALTAGVAIDEGPIWSGEVALTDLIRHYADPTLNTANAFGVAGRLTWRPTELTSFDATSSVSLDETATAGVAASKTWTTGLNFTHALRDNLSVLGGTSLSLQNTGKSVDRTNTATLGLNWQVNPNMSAGVTYEGTWFTAGTGGGDYNDQRVMTNIILQD